AASRACRACHRATGSWFAAPCCSTAPPISCCNRPRGPSGVLRLLIQFCVRKRLPVLAATMALAAYGVKAYLDLPVEAFPDVTNLQVQVIAQLPGLAPEEIERQVTVPIERVLNGTPQMALMRSESLFGLSLVTLTFDDDADPV